MRCKPSAGNLSRNLFPSDSGRFTTTWLEQVRHVVGYRGQQKTEHFWCGGESGEMLEEQEQEHCR